MAIYDVLFEFSDAQAITASAQSTDTLDWGSGLTGLNMGAGTPIWLNIRVDAADFATLTSLTFSLYSHTAATSIQSGTLLFSTAAIARASLTAGAWVLRMPLPYNCDVKRYMALYYTVGGSSATAGAINAWLDAGAQSDHNTQVASSNI